MKTRISLIVLFFLAVGSYSYGQQLVYTPKNPAFGGDPFAGNWLLNVANAQNPFDDDQQAVPGLDNLSALDQSLNNQLLGQLGGGDLNGLQTGTSADGNFEFEVFDSLDGLVVNILDLLSGEQTQIVIPN